MSLRALRRAVLVPVLLRLPAASAVPRLPARSLHTALSRPQFRMPSRSFSSHTEKVPGLGDSISSAVILTLSKQPGDYVREEEVYASLETDKVTVEVRATKSGKVLDALAKVGDTVEIGQGLLTIDTAASAPAGEAPKAEKQGEAAKPKEVAKEPAAAKEAAKEPAAKEPAAKEPAREAPKEAKDKAPAAAPKPAAPPKKPIEMPTAPKGGSRTDTDKPLSQMRLTIATRLKDAQNTAAMLTTFNEIDMTNIMNLRAKHKGDFEAAHGVKLGFMSAFVKASAYALIKNPNVNAMFDMKKKCITYHDYVDISVAVSTPTGLVVPVIRDCQSLSYADIEKTIIVLGEKARSGQITRADMQGGTFTISNGGVYGSLFGTPILNPPQSAILGMHGIFKRPIAVDDQVVVRPMMYVALTYDHRIIDGKDAVMFLKDVKGAVEDPMRLVFEL